MRVPPTVLWCSRVLVLLLLLASSLLSCSGGGGENSSAQTATTASTSTLRLSLTDAPVDDAAEVIVQFTGVELQSDGGERLEFTWDTPKQIDLLELHSGRREVLLEEDLPPGRYNWVRLLVDAELGVEDSFIGWADGTVTPLRIPSGDQSGLKIVQGFDVTDEVVTDFVIDFDLRKSIHQPAGLGGDYLLRPTLRLVALDEVGHITGEVDPALLSANSCTGGDVVYVFAGSESSPDDVDGVAAEPITTARVELEVATGRYTYTAAFLPAGDYMVAFTCQAGSDAPETDDVLTFIGTADVTVIAGTETIQDF